MDEPPPAADDIRPMRSSPSPAPPLTLFLLLLLPALLTSTIVTADLNSDRQALLAFSSSVPHVRNLNWSTSTPVCSNWTGVKCSSDNSRVVELRLPGIGLIGPIPPNTLGKLDALRVLSLRLNRLSSPIPPDITSLRSLRFLFLQSNQLSGPLPASLPPNLSVLDLSLNAFSGVIPQQAFRNLSQLTGINLANNSLTGTIPDFGNATLFSAKLRHLNVSYNNFNGSIPPSLQKFGNTSFLGNPGLCGPPLFAVCPGTIVPSSPAPPAVHPPTTSPSSNNRLSLKVIIGIAAGGLALLLLVVIILLLLVLKKRRGEGAAAGAGTRSVGTTRVIKGKGPAASSSDDKPSAEQFSSGAQEAEKNKLVFFEGCAFNFDLEDLLRASAEVLGKGSYGTAYKAVLEDGTTVVVKRLKDVVVGKKEFEQQMEVIGRVGQNPEHVVPLRAYYYSKDEKLLVYDYMPEGSFGTLLHGNRNNGGAPIDWETRVKITLGAARGVARIHAEGGGKFVHGNIRSSNVLLTQELDGCVSDFGLAPLMNVPATPRNMVGYRAPELIEHRKFSQKSDVYSFGVLILEMLTGKAPLKSPGGNDDIVDLPRWVQSVVREEWTAEVFDVELMKYPNIEEEMVQMLQIAMTCVMKNPDQRPRMEDVISLIERIRQPDSGNRPSSEDRSKDSNVTPPQEES